ncbi:MAG TPA: response regulator transcription factor [Bradyrhizobium sp.]|nr:response regulator transcription factor [Bradyrhizobium sp.]
MRVLIIDDHPMIVSGCRALLSHLVDIDVIDAADGKAGYHAYFSLQPDVAVVDINLPTISGLELCRRIVVRDPDARIIIFSMHDDPIFAARAIDAGAKGYVSKNDDPSVFIEAVQQVARGAVFLQANVARALAFFKAGGGSSPLTDLSRRELEILRLIGAGRTMAELAGIFDLSYKTLANSCTVLKKKLGARNLTDLARIALDHKLV